MSAGIEHIDVELTKHTLISAYRQMRTIRSFEEAASKLYRDSKIPGFVHLSLGQEAVAVGTCAALETADVITSTHRGHGHCLAKGLEPYEMFAELMGKATGVCKGRGGSMHIADPSRGILGANGIVGAGLPISVGAATAAQFRDDQSVVVCFFGDGAIAQGMFHESLVLAAAWKLPVIFLCENNHFAEFSTAESVSEVPLETRIAGYGIPYRKANGNDVEEVTSAVRWARNLAATGNGPIFVEAETYRWAGHYEGDPQPYRPDDELERWKLESDPLQITRQRLAELGYTSDFAAADLEVMATIDDAILRATADPLPTPSSVLDFVYSKPPGQIEPIVPYTDSGETWRYMDAVRAAIEAEMETDERVFMAGIDVGAGGNVFGLFRGLQDRFPGRVRDTPILETAIMGTAVGAAMAGMKPIVELMYMDFIGVCLDQIMNQAAKMRYMTGGKASMPLVIRTQFGAGRSSGSQHSQSLEALLAHIPGLKVVMPSDPASTYGLLRSAIRDEDPVVFVENRLLYGRKGPKPTTDHIVPIGRAATLREGTDVTIVSYSRMVHEALAAADELSKSGISAEVIDLQTVVPWDREAVRVSLAKTNRLVIAHEAVKGHGLGAEIAAFAVDEGFWSLDGPVGRVGAAASPAPYSPSLEAAWLPGRKDIVNEVRRIYLE